MIDNTINDDKIRHRSVGLGGERNGIICLWTWESG